MVAKAKAIIKPHQQNTSLHQIALHSSTYYVDLSIGQDSDANVKQWSVSSPNICPFLPVLQGTVTQALLAVGREVVSSGSAVLSTVDGSHISYQHCALFVTVSRSCCRRGDVDGDVTV